MPDKEPQQGPESLRLPAARGAPVMLMVDGQPVPAYEGETIAAALLAAGKRVFRRTARGHPRGLFCGMGVCFDCLVTVDGQGQVRACLTQVRAGMQVGLTGPGPGSHLDESIDEPD